MTPQVEAIWSLSWLAGVGFLLAALPRLGRLEVASWLTVLGIGLLMIEEPLLTFWFALADSRTEIDGIADLVTSQAQAHVFVASAWAIAWAGVLIWVARARLRRHERWSWFVLLVGLVVAGGSELLTSLLVFSRGLPLPTSGGVAGSAGLGWQPVAVGLLAWSLGLALARGTVLGVRSVAP